MSESPFKKTLIQTTRALSGQSDLQVYFSEKMHVSESAIYLPELKAQGENLDLLKGQADRLAFTYRYGYTQQVFEHFKKADKQFLYALSMFETALCESQGLKDFTGSTQNIEALQKEELKFFETAVPTWLHEVFSLSLQIKKRQDQRVPQNCLNFIENMRPFISPDLDHWLENALFETLEQRLAAYDSFYELYKKSQEPAEGSGESTEDDTETTEQKNVNGEPTPMGESESLKELDGDNLKSLDSGEETDEGYSFIDTDQALQTFFQVPDDVIEAYKVFTKVHDLESSIHMLISDSEKEMLKQKFHHISKMHKGLAKRLSKMLQDKLLSELRVGWRFEQEEGVLDAAKLATFIASGHSKIFRLPQRRDVMDTTVSILVDNSGSMRGRPIEMAALTTDILARTLDKCGVKVEVLGFTTRSWKGGESRLDWISAGRPEHPGRLNDVMHVIYKSAHQPYVKCKDNFAFMLGDDLLKENIDGESLKWAYKRIVKRSESRKILMVISDGAPVDYATDRHNITGYLDKNLKDTISQVEKNKSIELLAIGIGHDVDNYYKNAVVIENAETLADTLLNEMVKLFDT